jgi:vancomycin resistance protein YoaR
MPIDTGNLAAALRDVADTLLKGTSAEVRAARLEVQRYVSELIPEVEVALTEAAAASEDDRQTWVDTLKAQADAVALRTLRKAKAISLATERRIRDATLVVLLTAVRLAA